VLLIAPTVTYERPPYPDPGVITYCDSVGVTDLSSKLGNDDTFTVALEYAVTSWVPLVLIIIVPFG